MLPAAYADGIRDLLGVLDVERATLVGHSLGSGVAMQFAYQFPERTERLVLVGSGGAGPDVTPVLRMVDALPDATARAAFIRTLRAVVDGRGQVVTMLDRCYLTRGMPTMLVWGGRDAVVPLAHAHRAHTAMPGSRPEIFDDAGHFPFHTDPLRFVSLLEEFLSTTEPARWSPEQWRELLRSPDAPPTGPLPPAAERNAT